MNQRVLDQRYELLELIGGGGMADVYKAKDLLLDRPVAVKILHDQFKSDTEFTEKFHREAQAAAKLSHPNIVNIYDVGISGDLHYIVMEYVPGKTLKDKIKQEGHLSVDESLRIAKDIASALSHAHANNLVHCDIKPHNILMMPDGSAKVADFGIARAVTESTMTYSGNVVGSVHYFSPEQARGTKVTPKSDVYSLGIVLYEMLTGQLPFTGETPVSVAVKQVQEEPVPVRKLDPSIPPVVEALVSRAMSKDPNMRPTSAEFVREITQAQQMLGTGPSFRAQPGQMDPEATQVLPRVQTPMPGKPVPREAYERQFANDEKEADKGGDDSLFHSKKFIVGLVAVLVIGFFAGAFMSFGKFWSTTEVSVPDVTGKQMAIAEQMLEKEKLRYTVKEEFDTDTPAGTVISQDPAAGTKVKEDRLVTITVSKGAENMDMPDLTGLSKDDAVAKIEKMGLKVGLVSEKNSDESAGTVIETDPKSGSKVTKGDTVDLTISKGPKETKVGVPDVTGDSESKAESELKAAGFSIGSVTKQASKQAAGTVISQTPSGGSSVTSGSSVSLVISSGPSKDEKKSSDKSDESSHSDSSTQSSSHSSSSSSSASTPKQGESSKSR